MPASGSKSRTTKNNLLETFVRRENEITSTNDVIDLTGSVCEDERDENSPAKSQSPGKLALKSPVQSKAESKEKSEDHFARKLVFDEKTAEGQEKSADSNKGGVVSRAVSPTKEDTCEDVLMESEVECTDLCAKEDNDVQMEEDGQIDDKTPNTSVLETSGTDAVASSSTPQKEESDESSTETPVSKKCSVPASTPETPASMNTSCSSVDGAPTSDNKTRVSLILEQDEQTFN